MPVFSYLAYPKQGAMEQLLKDLADNAGIEGSVIVQKVKEEEKLDREGYLGMFG